MREYARVSPKFWIGATGRDLRRLGKDAQLVAMYLLTSPHSNMIGMFWQPISYIGEETGVGAAAAKKALESLVSINFCCYDELSQVVWVREMARYQIGDRLNPKDKQVKGVQNVYDEVPSNPFLIDFFREYSEDLCLAHARTFDGPSEVLGRALEGASKQEKAQAQAQEKATAQAQAAAEPAVLELPLVGGAKHAVTRTRIDFWRPLYPKVDVEQELRKMAGWLDANRERQKTVKGIDKFVTSWLARAQDSGGSPASLGQAPVGNVVPMRAPAVGTQAGRIAAALGALDDFIDELSDPRSPGASHGTDDPNIIDTTARRVA